MNEADSNELPPRLPSPPVMSIVLDDSTTMLTTGNVKWLSSTSQGLFGGRQISPNVSSGKELGTLSITFHGEYFQRPVWIKLKDS